MCSCFGRKIPSENWKWTLFSLVIGVHDVVSDFTKLAVPDLDQEHLLLVLGGAGEYVNTSVSTGVRLASPC
jgi:hypothetical protein